MPAASSPGGSLSLVTCGRSRASGGWSHSWVTPTTCSPSPSAKSSSVACGTRDTIRMEEESMSAWREDGEALVRDLRFADFAAAMAFVNRVAAVAEEANHHPDIDRKSPRLNSSHAKISAAVFLMK